MTSQKFKLQNYWSSRYITSMMYKGSWKLISIQIFCSEWALGFAMDHAWIPKLKLLRDAVFTWRPSWLKSDLFRDLFRGFGYLKVLVLEKVVLYCFLVPREINLRFCSKTQWQMFLLVSGRHVGAHPDGHQHGISMQSSVNLDNTLLQIACKRKIAETWFLARLFILQLSIISQILELIYWTITIFSFDHMTDENREL